ncbi:unnamed protein product [Oppiella nova]|uniref:SET domain-containing protein n=1 Tax=Oppiella nova TaxID=334625 RepID=A0A7R9LCH5_9ACAR|nr:unnamed protein product [Oppiella nova]CAG2162132.1 unnamed protein product [Oppiella nova]
MSSTSIHMSAIFLDFSLMSHSCQPNTAYVLKGDSVEVRAMRSIAPGDEITMSYVSLDENRTERLALNFLAMR